MRIDPAYIARPEAGPSDNELMFGQEANRDPSPEQAQLADDYLIFGTAQGRRILDDLIKRYVAAPVFDATRDAAKGFERNGEANVVRDICTRLETAQRNLERRM